jgi:protein pelota
VFFLFADVCVLLITEGLANLALVGGSMTVFKAKVEKAMPRKSGAAAMGYRKALGTFHKNVMAALESKVDFEKVREFICIYVYSYFRYMGNVSDDVFCYFVCIQVKCVVVAGPGFAKDSFMKYVDLEAARQDKRLIIENRSKFLECHASTAFKGALREVLESPEVRYIFYVHRTGNQSDDVVFYSLTGFEKDRGYEGGEGGCGAGCLLRDVGGPAGQGAVRPIARPRRA